MASLKNEFRVVGKIWLNIDQVTGQGVVDGEKLIEGTVHVQRCQISAPMAGHLAMPYSHPQGQVGVGGTDIIGIIPSERSIEKLTEN